MSNSYRFCQIVSILAGLAPFAGLADSEVRPKGPNAYQLVTGDDADDHKGHWDTIYNTRGYVFGREPAPFLRDHLSLLPPGKVLDIAMGEGRNAVFLAKKGFDVEGVDISEVAIRKAKRLARDNGVQIRTVAADLNSYSIRPGAYDVILNINYLQRSLVPGIKKGLKKGGVVVYENATVEQLQNPSGQQASRDFLLEKGELRELFKDFEILVFRETNDGKEALASLIARKP